MKTEEPQRLSRGAAWTLAFISGFLSLGWEIAWARLYNFITSSRAVGFGLMLGCYLLGLAVGSLLARHWLKRIDTEHESAPDLIGGLFGRSSLAAFAVVPSVSVAVTFVWWPWTLPAVVLGSMMLGTVLPVLCHLAIPPDQRAGRGMSGIYLANILGSGAGSLGTGFVLMEYLTMQQLTFLLTCTGLTVATWLVMLRPKQQGMGWKGMAGICVFLLGGFVLMEGLWERLQYHTAHRFGMRFPVVIESRHGVITVDSQGAVYGNGAYDGTQETGLEPGSWLVRPYFISALHRKPERVLVIGVSGGAWTQILAHHPDVKEVVGIEISHAYLQLLAMAPATQSLRHNPKVRLIIDDGRRWLRRHPEERFDLIVMNTTHHWREFAAALLSREFLSLAGSRLREGGIVAWNTTGSARAAKTGLDVFPHTLMAMNFCVGSFAPLVPDKAHWGGVLERWQLDGRPVFDPESRDGHLRLEGVLRYADLEGPWDPQNPWRWTNRAHMEQQSGGAEVITDDNLGHEFDSGNW